MSVQWSKVPRTSVGPGPSSSWVCGLKGLDHLLTNAKATFQVGLDAAVNLQQGAAGVPGKKGVEIQTL